MRPICSSTKPRSNSCAAIRSRRKSCAYESFKNGPQVGTLCVQNWQTIVEARKIFNDPDYRVVAEGKRDQCKVKRPVRL